MAGVHEVEGAMALNDAESLAAGIVKHSGGFRVGQDFLFSHDSDF